MITFEDEEIKFIKNYKKQCELEIIQLNDYKKSHQAQNPVFKAFNDRADNRLFDLEFLYHIFDKLEKEVSSNV